MERLTASHIDQCLGYRYIGNMFAFACCVPLSLHQVVDALFKACDDLKPYESNDYGTLKCLWIRVPRGSYEDYCKTQYVNIPRRRWHTARGYGNGKTAIHIMRNEMSADTGMYSYVNDLCDLLTQALSQSMEMVRAGTYNSMLEVELPYRYRFGVVKAEYTTASENADSGNNQDEDPYISIMPCFVSSRDSYYMIAETKYGVVGAFMHVDDADIASFGDKIEWDPLTRAELNNHVNEPVDDYSIPDDIETLIPPHFYAAFAGELFSTYGWKRGRDIFYPERPLSDRYMCDFQSGNALWTNAFRMTCRKLKLDTLLNYYESLRWDESDHFDGIMEERINERFIQADNRTYSWYLNETLLDE